MITEQQLKQIAPNCKIGKELVVVQWGYNSDATNTSLDINFPFPLPNQCVVVLATGDAISNPNRAEIITVTGLTRYKFTWYGTGGHPSGTISEPSKGWWLAIGF